MKKLLFFILLIFYKSQSNEVKSSLDSQVKKEILRSLLVTKKTLKKNRAKKTRGLVRAIFRRFTPPGARLRPVAISGSPLRRFRR